MFDKNGYTDVVFKWYQCLYFHVWNYNHYKENNCKLYGLYKCVVMTPTRHYTLANAGTVRYITINKKKELLHYSIEDGDCYFPPIFMINFPPPQQRNGSLDSELDFSFTLFCQHVCTLLVCEGHEATLNCCRWCWTIRVSVLLCICWANNLLLFCDQCQYIQQPESGKHVEPNSVMVHVMYKGKKSMSLYFQIQQ